VLAGLSGGKWSRNRHSPQSRLGGGRRMHPIRSSSTGLRASIACCIQILLTCLIVVSTPPESIDSFLLLVGGTTQAKGSSQASRLGQFGPDHGVVSPIPTHGAHHTRPGLPPSRPSLLVPQKPPGPSAAPARRLVSLFAQLVHHLETREAPQPTLLLQLPLPIPRPSGRRGAGQQHPGSIADWAITSPSKGCSHVVSMLRPRGFAASEQPAPGGS